MLWTSSPVLDIVSKLDMVLSPQTGRLRCPNHTVTVVRTAISRTLGDSDWGDRTTGARAGDHDCPIPIGPSPSPSSSTPFLQSLEIRHTVYTLHTKPHTHSLRVHRTRSVEANRKLPSNLLLLHISYTHIHISLCLNYQNLKVKKIVRFI